MTSWSVKSFPSEVSISSRAASRKRCTRCSARARAGSSERATARSRQLALLSDAVASGPGSSAVIGEAYPWDCSSPREPEHPLGDDVPLDLRGAAGDRAGEAAEIAFEPAGGEALVVQRIERRAPMRVVQRIGPERLEDVQRAELDRFGTEQLQQRLLGGLHPPLQLGEHAVAEQSERVRVQHQPAVPIE